MKVFLRILFSFITISLSYGLYHKNFIDFNFGERIVGFTVIIAAFIYLPIFLYHRWKGKKLKDYVLSEKNLRKIKNRKLK
ncbi:MAG: hypothetical protein CBC28_06775 [Flavobacteriaceae bacterium TMED68]|nr:MAG: hypothetical protein CBC28_06775 [Flavobacteriaceae bacterium TMED68]|tara:strand:+ start:44238 stop:44477 length:240 start_codon:yes stop_codon:yes gene_type:complete